MPRCRKHSPTKVGVASSGCRIDPVSVRILYLPGRTSCCNAMLMYLKAIENCYNIILHFYLIMHANTFKNYYQLDFHVLAQEAYHIRMKFPSNIIRSIQCSFKSSSLLLPSLFFPALFSPFFLLFFISFYFLTYSLTQTFPPLSTRISLFLHYSHISYFSPSLPSQSLLHLFNYFFSLIPPSPFPFLSQVIVIHNIALNVK